MSHFMVKYFHLNEREGEERKTDRKAQCSRAHFKQVMRLSAKLNKSIEFEAGDDGLLSPLNELLCQMLIFMFNFFYRKKQTSYMELS